MYRQFCLLLAPKHLLKSIITYSPALDTKLLYCICFGVVVFHLIDFHVRSSVIFSLMSYCRLNANGFIHRLMKFTVKVKSLYLKWMVQLTR